MGLLVSLVPPLSSASRALSERNPRKWDRSFSTVVAVSAPGTEALYL